MINFIRNTCTAYVILGLLLSPINAINLAVNVKSLVLNQVQSVLDETGYYGNHNQIGYGAPKERLEINVEATR